MNRRHADFQDCMCSSKPACERGWAERMDVSEAKQLKSLENAKLKKLRP